MLGDILPREQLLARFGARLILEEFGIRDLGKIVEMYPSAIFGIGANVWNRIVTKRWHRVDPQAMSRYFQDDDPRLPIAIGRLIDQPIIHDIYFVKGWDGERTKEQLVVQMVVAVVHKNDLHLADVTFVDPTQPIAEPQRRSQHQTHKGLGLLPQLFRNMERVGTELNCSELTLTATTRSTAELFSQFGFKVEDSSTGELAMEQGFGIPMEKPLP